MNHEDSVLQAGGLNLSPLHTEQRYLIEVSVSKLADESGRIFRYWGCVTGEHADYYILQSYMNSVFEGDVEYHYSLDLSKWYLLPEERDEGILKLTRNCRRGFSGNPGEEMEIFDIQRAISVSNNKDTNGEEGIVLREDRRLSIVVRRIDFDTAVAPLASFVVEPEGNGGVYRNKSFRGLALRDCTEFHNWIYLRPLTHYEFRLKRDPRRRHFLFPATEMLERLSDTDFRTSRGAFFAHEVNNVRISNVAPLWKASIPYYAGDPCEHVLLTSFKWKGAYAYHRIMTNQFARYYHGNGLPNLDLAFALPAGQIGLPYNGPRVNLVPEKPRINFRTDPGTVLSPSMILEQEGYIEPLAVPGVVLDPEDMLKLPNAGN